MKAFSFSIFVFVIIFNTSVKSQNRLYLQGNGVFFSINKYNFDNSEIFTGKENAFKPTFGHPQILAGYKFTLKSAFEIGVIYRINTFNFEGNVKNANNALSIDLSNSIGIPIRYRYHLNDFSGKNNFRFSLNAGFVTLFQSEINKISQTGKIDYLPYSITYSPYNFKKISFVGELGLAIEKKISDKLSFSFDYNYWLGFQEYAKIDLIFKNTTNGSITNGSVLHSGTSHNLSIGLRYTFTD